MRPNKHKLLVTSGAQVRSTIYIPAFLAAVIWSACGGGNAASDSQTAPRSNVYASIRQASDDFVTVDFPGAVLTTANEIANNGDIVGTFDDSSLHRHGYLFRNGTFTQIDFPDAILTNVTGVNDDGDLVGRYTADGGTRHGFMLSGGTFTTIDYPDSPRTRVSGINSDGDILGDHCDNAVEARCMFSDMSAGNVHGFILSDSEFTSIDYPDATYTEAWKRDRKGDILGRYRDVNRDTHLYTLDNNGEFNSIDFPGAIETAYGNFSDSGGLNDRGDIVSHYCDAAPCPLAAASATGNVHGFLLTRRGVLSIIDIPDSLLTAPFGINRHRDIVGIYLDASGSVHGFLLPSGRDRER